MIALSWVEKFRVEDVDVRGGGGVRGVRGLGGLRGVWRLLAWGVEYSELR